MCFSIGGCRYHNENDAQSDDVERRPNAIELSNPPRRHATNAPMNEHDKRTEQKDLVVLRHVVGVADGATGENQSGECVVD